MHIHLQGISKRFGETLANDRVDLELNPGRVTALLGENGAGKSTLMKIAFGYYPPDSGSLAFDGQTVTLRSPADAIARGVGMVFQQFSVIPALTVRENLALAARRTRWWLGRGARTVVAPLRRLRQLAPDIDPGTRAADLSVGQLQLVELVKVLNLEARTIILDEPTSVLAPSEAAALRERIRELAGEGRSIVLITHKLEDVFACCDDVVVMRGGRVVATLPVKSADAETLVRLIIGEGRHTRAPDVPPPHQGIDKVILRNLGAMGPNGRVADIDLALAAGEIVGIAGVSGNGQQTLAEAVAGLLPLLAGEVIVDGVTLQAPRAQSACRDEIAYLPEHPLRNALAGELSVAVNLMMNVVRGLPFLPDRRALRRQAMTLIERFAIRPPDPELPASALSGGNQQKLVAARELSRQPVLVIACYPTMGLDLDAGAAVYDALFAHARRGACVLWISEDLDDLLRYAHRIVVLHGGRIAGCAHAGRTSREQIGRWMVGHAHG